MSGLFLDQPSLAGKWIELLREASPTIERVALLWDRVTGVRQIEIAKSDRLLRPRSSPVLKQSFIPGFPVGAQRVGASLSILEKDGRVTCFVGGDNYFSHPQEDMRSRRFALASLMDG